MNTSTIISIVNDMGQQKKVLKRLNELIDDCEDRLIFGEVKEEDIQHLRDYCADMLRAADTAEKLAEALRPIYKEEDDKRKAEEEKKKKDEAAAKRSKAATKAAATRKAAEEKKKAEEQAEAEDKSDDDADFLD